MTELKAYSCMETYSGEWKGAIIFAKTNLQARKWAANEFNDGELGGLQVTRAPWADKYGSRSKVPAWDMIEHGWHFECYHSSVIINSDTYYDGVEIYDSETETYIHDPETINQFAVGFQDGPIFACQKYHDEYYEEKRKKKEFEEESVKPYREIVLKRLPDAVLIDSDAKFGSREYIYSISSDKEKDIRVVEEISIPFEFPGQKHWAALKLRREPDTYQTIGPMKPYFVCASADLEAFYAWEDKQK